MSEKRKGSSWLILGAVLLPLLCCGLPVLLAAGTLTAVGGGLAAHGFGVAGGALLVLAALLAGRWWIRRRRCDVPGGLPDELPRA